MRAFCLIISSVFLVNARPDSLNGYGLPLRFENLPSLDLFNVQNVPSVSVSNLGVIANQLRPGRLPSRFLRLSNEPATSNIDYPQVDWSKLPLAPGSVDVSSLNPGLSNIGLAPNGLSIQNLLSQGLLNSNDGLSISSIRKDLSEARNYLASHHQGASFESSSPLSPTDLVSNHNLLLPETNRFSLNSQNQGAFFETSSHLPQTNRFSLGSHNQNAFFETSSAAPISNGFLLHSNHHGATFESATPALESNSFSLDSLNQESLFETSSTAPALESNSFSLDSHNQESFFETSSALPPTYVTPTSVAPSSELSFNGFSSTTSSNFELHETSGPISVPAPPNLPTIDVSSSSSSSANSADVTLSKPPLTPDNTLDISTSEDSQSIKESLNKNQYSIDTQTGSTSSIQQSSKTSEDVQIFKHVYFHVPPEDVSDFPKSATVKSPPKQIHHKIIFIKAPNQENKKYITPPATTVEEKTRIYVLVKKPEAPPINIPSPETTTPSKPEVFFVRYKAKSSGVERKGENILQTDLNVPSRLNVNTNSDQSAKEFASDEAKKQQELDLLDSFGGPIPDEENDGDADDDDLSYNLSPTSSSAASSGLFSPTPPVVSLYDAPSSAALSPTATPLFEPATPPYDLVNAHPSYGPPDFRKK